MIEFTQKLSSARHRQEWMMRKLVAQLSFPVLGQRQAGTERFDLGRQRIQRGLHAGRNFGSQTFDLNGGAIVDVVVRPPLPLLLFIAGATPSVRVTSMFGVHSFGFQSIARMVNKRFMNCSCQRRA